MKKKLSPVIPLLLSLILLAGMFPVTVFASNDEFVLTAINHLSAISIVDVSESHTAVLTVSYTHPDTLDFSSGLDIAYDTSIYASASASFPSGSEAIVGGAPVAMTVTYQKNGNAALYTASYSLSVVRAAGTASSFTGTITKTLKAPETLAFTMADFTGLYTQNSGGPLSSIVITGSNPAFGGLKWGGGDYVFGTPVSLAQIQAGTLTFAATAEGTVSYTVKASAAEAPETLIGGVVLTITASAETDNAEEEEEDDGSCHFPDVGNRHRWAVQAVDYLYEAGIVTGDGEGCYNPNASISRGDFILMLCRAFDLSADDTGSFSDVEEDSYYAGAIATAKALKIARGAGGRFNPNASLSRQDAMVLMIRAMEAAGLTLQTGEENGLNRYCDRSRISNYASESVAALVNAGVIQGSGGRLNPKASVSRAEMAVILYRVLSM